MAQNGAFPVFKVGRGGSNDALNAVCPYYTMYPLDFPLRVLKEHGKRGDWVIDPFCGRGTTNFAARLLEMPSVGVDSSPVAAALAQAKLATAAPSGVVASARAILKAAKEPTALPTGAFWKLAYHERTLVQLCQLREALLAECSSHTRILLRAIVLGALHGPRPKGAPSYFSNQSPRTFAPKPKYAVKFWTARACARTTSTCSRSSRRGRTATSRSRRRTSKARCNSATAGWRTRSPTCPRLASWSRRLRTSACARTCRTSGCGSGSLVAPTTSSTASPRRQLEHSGADHFAAEMGRVWKNVANHTTKSARLIIRYGGIHDRDAEPMDVLKKSLVDSGWKMKTAKAVPDSDSGRRQVRQFQAEPKKAITEYDVYCPPC
jgi:hypothetical protein